MQIGAQLYTLRDYVQTEEGFIDALSRCADIGYTSVQISAVACMNGDTPEVDAVRGKELLDRFELTCCATHRPFASLVNNTQFEIDFHHTLGCEVVGISGVFDSGDVIEGYRRFLDAINPVAEQLAAAGLKFAYHNHSHEFIRDPETGLTFFDYMLQNGPSNMQVILDTYWVVNAGVDCADLMHRLSGRINVIHAKDRQVITQRGPVMAPVGEGLMNWETILAAARSGGTKHVVVEQDECFRDPFDCLRSSYEFLKSKV